MYETEVKIMSEFTTSEVASFSPTSAAPHTKAPQRIGTILTGFLCLFLILRHSDAAIAYMKQGLSLCAGTVIPSLFPFMVISELLVCSGGGELLGGLFEKPFKRLFGISAAGASAVMMGWICGFPIGTKTAVSLCRRGIITSDELSDLICYCNIPSSAFLINAVGVSLFGNRRFGLLLYVICILSSLITAAILHRMHPRPASPHPLIRMNTVSSGALIQSVTSATTAMLYVCAYILFFSAMSGALGELLTHLQLGQSSMALIFGILEMSGGIMQASALSNPIAARQIAALLCGWSGISVHMQILSLCAGYSIRIKPYLTCKILQGLFCAVMCSLLIRFFPSAAPIPSMQTALPVVSSPFAFYLFCCINLSLILLVLGAVNKLYTQKKSVPRKRT
jgi:sporulation integral membrane protein YlbJ